MRKLREPYVVVADPEETRAKILLESARLFALKGYAAVSVKDIATAADILPGSLYSHYGSKEEVLSTIMDRTKRELNDFYRILDKENAKAETFEEIVGNIFVELKESTNAFSHYSLWCAMNEQFNFDFCREIFYDIFLMKGKDVMKRQLDLAIEKKYVKPFDTEGLATYISSSVILMMPIHAGIRNGYYEDFNIVDWYSKQIDHVLQIAELLN